MQAAGFIEEEEAETETEDDDDTEAEDIQDAEPVEVKNGSHVFMEKVAEQTNRERRKQKLANEQLDLP